MGSPRPGASAALTLPWHRAAGATALLVLLLLAARAFAQQGISAGKFTNYQLPILSDDGKRTMVRGKEAEPVGNGFIRLVEARVESYGTNRELELLIEAPLAFYNRATQRAFSQDRLKVTAEGGKLQIEGTGFEWDPRQSLLVISNDVRAIVAQELLSTNFANRLQASDRQAQPLVITSRSLRATSARADFNGVPRAELTEGVMTAEERLSIHFGANQREIRKLEGARNVVIEREDFQMSGDRAEYTIINTAEVLHVHGNGRWRKGERRGQADVIQYEPARARVSAVGSSRLEAPLFRGSETNRAAAEAPLVLVDAHAFNLQMATPSAAGQWLEAHTNVVINIPSENSIARAQTAYFTETNGLLRLLGNPVWITPEWELSGRQIFINERAQTVHAWPNARLQVLASAFALDEFFRSESAPPSGQPWFVQGTSEMLFYSNDKMQFETNVHLRVLEGATERGWSKSDLLTLHFRPQSKESPSTNTLPALKSGSLDRVVALGNVTGEQLPWPRPGGDMVSKRLRAQEVLFTFQPGPVTALDTITVWENALLEQTVTNAAKAQPSTVSLGAEQIRAKFYPYTNRIEHIIASTNVVIKHPEGEGRGQRGVYMGTNDTVELTGNPVARMNAGHFQGPILTWQRAKKRFGTRGVFEGEWTRIDTNAPARSN